MTPMAADAQSPADVIRLVGLGGIGRHGVLPEERRDGQQFLVDLDIHVDTTAAAARDDLSRTVDYAAVAGEVSAIIEGEPVNLIETLAGRIADAVLAHEGVQSVGVTVHKPEAPLGLPFTDVQVQIHRSTPSPGAPAPAGGQRAVPQRAQQADADVAAGAMLAPAAVTGQAAAAADEGVPALSPASPDVEDNDVLQRDPDGEVAVVLGLGGNVGDVRSTLRAVVEDLRTAPGLSVQAVSPLARTAAVVEPDAPAQPDYLNAVVLATTTLSPMGLLNLTRSLEDSYGRERTQRWGQRTVDIDIIDYDGVSSTDEVLSLPHPRANERAFVLVPWSQVDPDAFLPGLGGGPVAMLAETAPDRGGVRWLALDWLERTGHGTDSGSFVVSHDVPPAPVHEQAAAAEQGDQPAPVVPPVDPADSEDPAGPDDPADSDLASSDDLAGGEPADSGLPAASGPGAAPESGSVPEAAEPGGDQGPPAPGEVQASAGPQEALAEETPAHGQTELPSGAGAAGAAPVGAAPAPVPAPPAPAPAPAPAESAPGQGAAGPGDVAAASGDRADAEREPLHTQDDGGAAVAAQDRSEPGSSEPDRPVPAEPLEAPPAPAPAPAPPPAPAPAGQLPADVPERPTPVERPAQPPAETEDPAPAGRGLDDVLSPGSAAEQSQAKFAPRWQPVQRRDDEES